MPSLPEKGEGRRSGDKPVKAGSSAYLHPSSGGRPDQGRGANHRVTESTEKMEDRGWRIEDGGSKIDREGFRSSILDPRCSSSVFSVTLWLVFFTVPGRGTRTCSSDTRGS